MKAIACCIAGSLGLLTAQAQFFGPESLGGALLGGVLGGVIGNNTGHHGGSGAAIGAGAGFLLGAIIGEERREREYPPVIYPSPYPPAYYYPSAVAYPDGPSPAEYAVGGAAVGAASGALIGSAYGPAGRGALVGAGAGLLVGGLSAPRPVVVGPVPPPSLVVYPGGPVAVAPAAASTFLSAPVAPAAPVAPLSPLAPANALFGR